MMEYNLILSLAMAAFIAYLTKRLTGKLGIPIVTGYVIMGVFLGVSLLKVFRTETLDRLDIISDFALGIIGFTIGSELKKEVFQKLGKSIFLIAAGESILACIVVTVCIYAIHPSKLYQALIFGAVASATAPAATVHVIRQYKSRGPLTSTILAVVGIDDAFALILFTFALAVSKSLLSAEHISFLSIFLSSGIEIALSIVLGIFTGLLFFFLFRNTRFPDDLLLGVSAFILAILGISRQFHLSGLLAAMVFGAVVTNAHTMLMNRSVKILEGISPLLLAFFFIFAGSHLDITLLPKIGLMGLVYLLGRAGGKIGGAGLGALMGKAPAVVKKYVGFSLIPQVGVAVALAIIVKKEFGIDAYGPQGAELSSLVINILLFTTIITEIVGPLLTKMALTKAGEREALTEGE